MYAIMYRIKTLSPVILTSKTGDPNVVATHDYIPGTHLLGLFANEYLMAKGSRGEDDERFVRFFLEGKLKFLNGYIADFGSRKPVVFIPLPVALQKEKYGSLAYNLLDYESKPETDTKPIDSYGFIDSDTVYTKSVEKTLNFHQKRDRIRGVSEPGLIFNYEAIEEDQIFASFVLGEKDDLKEFADLFKDGIYHLGRSKHTQYGKVHISIENREPLPFSHFHTLSHIEDDRALLYLTSDTIIFNEYGFPSTSVSDFEKNTGLKVEKSITGFSEKEGYVSVWKCKSPSLCCFRAGSSFLIKLDERSRRILSDLFVSGIGEMTSVGLGRFNLLPLTGTPYKVKAFDFKRVREKPERLSQVAKDLILSVVEQEILRHCDLEGISKAQEFAEESTIPPSSLISKLEKALRDGKLDEVLENIKGKGAEKKLLGCRTKAETLFDLLKSHRRESEKILINIPSLRSLIEELPEKTDLNALDPLLRRTYLLTLLSSLRKISKSMKGGKDAGR